MKLCINCEYLYVEDKYGDEKSSLNFAKCTRNTFIDPVSGERVVKDIYASIERMDAYVSGKCGTNAQFFKESLVSYEERFGYKFRPAPTKYEKVSKYVENLFKKGLSLVREGQEFVRKNWK